MVGILAAITNFLQVHYYVAYLILFLGSYFETLIGPGFFVYGEIFFLSGAILAGANILNIWLVAAVCIPGGILGDSSSYWIGREYGHLIIKKFFKRGNKYLTPQIYKKGAAFIHKDGLKGIFLARLMGPLSWITPFLAGTIKVKYKDFVKYNIPGVVTGISIFLIVGYLFGFSYNLILPRIERDVFYITIILATLGILLILRRYKVFDKLLDWAAEQLKF